MNKKTTLSLFLLISMYATSVQAQELFDIPNYKTDPIQCPNKISFLDVSNQYRDACTKKNYTEILTGSPQTPSAFETEIERFNNEVLERIYLDNPSNIDYLVQKGVGELRIHKQCLVDICQTIFEQCTDTQSNAWAISDVLNAQESCNNLIEESIMPIEQEKLTKVLYLNQTRKSQEAIHQQNTGLFVRLRRYMIPTFADVTRQLDRMVSKINVLIQEPATCENTGSC